LRLSLIASSVLVMSLSVWAVPFEAATDDANLDIVNKYLDATRTQQESLRGAQMEVNIDAKIPKLEKQGKLRALRRIYRLGRITYKALGFSGDSTIKQEVITRYLSAESEARDSGSIAITPANYKFKHKGSTSRDGRLTEIFQVTPRKKRVGLFRGELWLDAQTGMPVRESGRFVKTPSVFLKKVEFVRDYELRDGVSFPKHIESTVDTRLVGRAELSIDFSNYSRAAVSDDEDAATNFGIQ
jgi:hypothetical protein